MSVFSLFLCLFSFTKSKKIGNRTSLTCFSSKSELGEQHVTRCLVRCRKDASVSAVRWSRPQRCSIWDTTRKPRHCNMCCCTVLHDSTSEHTKPSNFELEPKIRKVYTWFQGNRKRNRFVPLILKKKPLKNTFQNNLLQHCY